MAHTVDEVNVLIKAQTEQFQAEIDRVNQKLNSISKAASTASSGVSGGIKNMGLKMAATGAIIGVVSAVTQKAMAAIAASTGDAIKRFDTLKNFPRVMQNLGISTKDSQDSIDYLSKKLEGLPTTLDAATTAVQRLTATNGNLRASTAIYLALNNAILAGGADAQLQASAMEQLQQAYAKGKPEMQDWKTLMQTMPAQLKQIANAMGYMDSSQLYNALQNGKTSMDDFMRAVVKLNKEGINGLGSFEQQAAGATGGVATSFMNMQNAIVRGITACMDAIGQSNIAGFFNVVKDVILTAANYVAAFVKLVLTAINAVRALFGMGSIGAKNVASSGGQAANSMANVGKAAQGSTKDIGDTTKAAKKLQKQLAGFDEMNVLSKQDTSGSGGSGGSGGGGSVSHDTSGLGFDNSDIAKGVDKVNAIFEKMKEGLKGFNFDKIGKAFKRFGDDIDKFIRPAKKILFDVWERLKPFIHWAGNELLPAFLNTLGGAIRLVGRVLESVWGNYLKPFVDSFLIPIANFTGGIIVGVLNGIGDAMRGLAENKGVIEFFTGIIQLVTNLGIAFVGCKVAIEAFTIAQTVCVTAMSFFTSTAPAVATTMSTLMFQIGAGTNSLQLMSTATNLAGFSWVSLKGVLSGIAGAVFSPLGIAIAGVTAVVTAFQVATEAEKLATEQANIAEAERIDITKIANQATSEYNSAIEWQKRLKDDLSKATGDVTNAELNLLDAQQRSADAQNTANRIASTYGMTIDQAKAYVANLDIASGNLSEKDKKLAEVILKLDQAHQRENTAVKNLSDSKGQLNQVNEDVVNATWKEVMASEKSKIASMLSRGEYDKVSESLQKLASKSGDYTNQNGQMVTLTKDKMADMANYIGDQLARVNDGNGQMWKNVWDAADSTTSKLRDISANEIVNNALRSGEGFGDGVANGIRNSRWRIEQEARLSAAAAKKAFNNNLGIHSPSRVMMKSGGWFSQGVAIGISDSTRDVIKSVASMAESAKNTFSDYDMNFHIPDISNPKIGPSYPSIDTLDITNAGSNSSTQPICLLLKVDSESIPISVERITDAINTMAFMKNRNVLEI